MHVFRLSLFLAIIVFGPYVQISFTFTVSLFFLKEATFVIKSRSEQTPTTLLLLSVTARQPMLKAVKRFTACWTELSSLILKSIL